MEEGNKNNEEGFGISFIEFNNDEHPAGGSSGSSSINSSVGDEDNQIDIWSDEIPRDDFYGWLGALKAAAANSDSLSARVISLDGRITCDLIWTDGVCSHTRYGDSRPRPISFLTNFDAMLQEQPCPQFFLKTNHNKVSLTKLPIRILKHYKEQRYPTILGKREMIQFLMTTKHPESTTSILGNMDVTGILKLIRSFVVTEEISQPTIPKLGSSVVYPNEGNNAFNRWLRHARARRDARRRQRERLD